MVGACLVSLGCGGSGFSPAKQAEYDRVRCETVALAPLALEDVDAVVHSLEDGIAIDDLFQLLAVAKDNIGVVKVDLATCRAQFPKL